MEASRTGRSGSLTASISRKVERVFSRLGEHRYFTEHDLEEFGYYRRHFLEALTGIEERISSGLLAPLDLSGFPREVRFSGYKLSVGLFIGSFDPFQMTHLATALRYLANPKSTGNAVFVIPEGGESSLKPDRSDYDYRLDILSRQLKGIFEPLIVPLDMGRDADTLKIVQDFMALFPGAKIDITHIIGSDVAPFAAKLMEGDLIAWGEASRELDVDFTYQMYVMQRRRERSSGPAIKAIKSLGVTVEVDRHSIEAPSSTDFRERGAFTIVFPTDEILSHLEVLFRYSLNKPWMPGQAPPEPAKPKAK
jgi:hypothetical protein